MADIREIVLHALVYLSNFYDVWNARDYLHCDQIGHYLILAVSQTRVTRFHHADIPICWFLLPLAHAQKLRWSVSDQQSN